jgi:hypothetical protein
LAALQPQYYRKTKNGTGAAKQRCCNRFVDTGGYSQQYD